MNDADQGKKVAVLMGSKSDWDVMQACAAQLEQFGVDADVRVLSAHRTPGALRDYVCEAARSGVEVFIAAAGMSAALAGTVAAETTLPVIGVPLEAGSLHGMDALLATVQMPPGVPVACMAIGEPGARNAAILAAQILALRDPGLAQRLVEFKQEQSEKVLKADEDLNA